MAANKSGGWARMRKYASRREFKLAKLPKNQQRNGYKYKLTGGIGIGNADMRARTLSEARGLMDSQVQFQAQTIIRSNRRYIRSAQETLRSMREATPERRRQAELQTGITRGSLLRGNRESRQLIRQMQRLARISDGDLRMMR